MVPALLEREDELAELLSAAHAAADGRGSATLVHGEAGIGKSSLVAALRQRLPAGMRMLTGYCDDLATPRPLGPIHDLLPEVGAELARILRDGADREHLLAALRTELRDTTAARGTVLVVEDGHWADEATLDVLRYLVRRVADLPVALIVTYRDDEADDGHRLRQLTAAAGRPGRLALQPLTRQAVRTMSAGTSVDPDKLHEVTSGNPFFVTEVLAHDPAAWVPPTVVDAVLARLLRLAPDVRGAVELLAVAGSTTERWLVEALASDEPCGSDGLGAAELWGLLTVGPTRVVFRHELTRRAVVDSLPGARRLALHARVLAALAGRPDVDPARLAHHATGAGDAVAIARYAPVAARRCAAAGAHREAVAHYRRALAHVERFPPAERAELLRRYAAECHTVGDGPAAVAAQLGAVQLARVVCGRTVLGADLGRLSHLYWWIGQPSDAERASREAIEVLTGAGDDRLLALAYGNQAKLDLVSDRYAVSLDHGDRAVALARGLSDPAILSHSLNTVGAARWLLGQRATGRSMIEESLRVALAANEVDDACRGYANLAGILIEELEPAKAQRYLDEAMDLATRTEHLGYVHYLRLVRALAAFRLGDWDRVIADAESVTDCRAPLARAGFLLFLGRIRIRRGEPGGEDLLARAARTPRHADELQCAGMIAAGRAEAAWQRGDHDAVRRHATPAYERARRVGHLGWERELGYWLARAGHPIQPPAGDHPYALQIVGDHARAAAGWHAAGHRYEWACALAESDRTDDLLRALAILDGLGARPLARRVRHRLQERDLPRVPRGPSRVTSRNPAGLTGRQVEVARLLAGARTNAEISQALVLSVRTVEHHVAAILGKLGVRTRREALGRLRDLGLNHGSEG